MQTLNSGYEKFYLWALCLLSQLAFLNFYKLLFVIRTKKKFFWHKSFSFYNLFTSTSWLFFFFPLFLYSKFTFYKLFVPPRGKFSVKNFHARPPRPKKHQILPLCLPNHSWSSSLMEKMRKSIKSFQTTLTILGRLFLRSTTKKLLC